MYRLQNFKKLGLNDDGYPEAEFTFCDEKFTFYCKDNSPLLIRLYENNGELLGFNDDEIFEMTGMNCPYYLCEAICDILNLDYAKHYFYGLCTIYDCFKGIDGKTYITISYPGYLRVDNGSRKIGAKPEFKEVKYREIVEIPDQFADQIPPKGTKIDMRILYNFTVIVKCYGTNARPIRKIKNKILTSNFIEDGYEINQSFSRRRYRSVKAKLLKQARYRQELDNKNKGKAFKRASRSNFKKI